MEDHVIVVENLNKVYPIYSHSMDRVKELFHPFRKSYHHDFFALKDISFRVKRGTSVGIIGKNGSGKSTLLKIISGVVTPTSGKVSVHGKVSALLELGAGFNPELTGYENIFFHGSIMGISEDQMKDHLQDILDFADIGEHIYQPIKTYSSGMFVRLAFSLATCIKPDILIVDEALAVGDMFFQSKCMMRMKHLISEHTTMIYVSHDIGSLKAVCDEALLLENGSIIASGPVSDVAETYFNSLFTQKPKHHVQDSSRVNFEKNKDFMRIQNGKAEILNVELLSESGKVSEIFDFNESITANIKIQSKESIEDLTYGIHIRDQYGVDVLYFDDSTTQMSLPLLNQNGVGQITLQTKLPLAEGDYVISILLSKLNPQGGIEIYDFIPLSYHFKMNKRQPRAIYGKVSLPTETRFQVLDV